MVPFGVAVLLWRLERGLSQQQLAKLAGVSRPNLSAMETGVREASLRNVRALALALDVRPGLLVDGIAPGAEEAKKGLSRAAMERISAAVVSGRTLSKPSEQALAGQLRHVVNSRLIAAGVKTRALRMGRATDRAWLKLSCYPEAVIEGLVARVVERSTRR